MKKICSFIFVLYIIIGLYSVFFVDATTVYRPFLMPSFSHLLGTNSYGLDIFALLSISIFNIVIISIFGFASFLLALSIGCLQGYLNEKYDFILQRFYEVSISIPFCYILILLGGYYSLNIFSLGIILFLFNWTFLIPIIRIHAFKLSTASFIVAMDNIGYCKKRIIFIHLIPTLYNNLKYLLPFVLILFISSLTYLDFLGLMGGSILSVGGLIAEGLNYLEFPIILVSAVSFLSIIFIALIVFFETNQYYRGN